MRFAAFYVFIAPNLRKMTILDYKSLDFIPFIRSYLIPTVNEGNQILPKMYQKDNCMTAEKIGFKIVQKISWKALYPHVNNILVNDGNDTFTLSRSLKYARFPYMPHVLINELMNSLITLSICNSWNIFQVDLIFASIS